MDSLQLLSPNRSSSLFSRIDPLIFRVGPKKAKVESNWRNIFSQGHILNCNSQCIYAQSTEQIMLKEKVAASFESDILIKISAGTSSPLGASKVENGINFALFSQHATSLTLCFTFSVRSNKDEPHDDMIEIDLDPQQNKTGDIWHVCVEGIPDSGVFYGYRVNGSHEWKEGHRFHEKHILLDPYAKLVSGRKLFGDIKNKMSKFLGTYEFNSLPFDWGCNYKLPNISEKDLVIYEMNVRAFTADESSGLDSSIRGSYIGVISKIPHLLDLGVNAVELLPIFEFDELELQRHPNPRDHMINTWGYSTVNFFAPMSRYASNGGGALTASEEFKQMVKALHEAGIEIILDVVYNHTNEADDIHPYTTSFRGIDNKVYYLMDFDNSAQLLNFSGCGNTLNCNHPVVMELILDSLRHWVAEYHVDGFRFDLASVLCRGTDGSPLNAPPLIKAIATDSVLSRCKIIAEPWDCGGLYLVGKFPNWDRWAEWNGKYRDDIRKFIKIYAFSFATEGKKLWPIEEITRTVMDLMGDPGLKGTFATRLSGSADLYQVNNRKPHHSVNFVVAHDGFTLHDLVSYNSKHNDANGEGGNDGCNDNFSWNCGFEGETNDVNILNLRSQQMKNFHLALMISQGTPMIIMGDEYAHTRYGNNNSYGHDTAINNFQWEQLAEKRDGHFRFFSEMIKFRLEHSILRHDRFLSKNDITWHEDNWENRESRFLAFTVHDDKVGEDIYVAFNAHDYVVKALVPSPPHKKHWHRVVDTNLRAPEDIVREGIPFGDDVYNVAPYSSILLKAKYMR